MLAANGLRSPWLSVLGDAVVTHEPARSDAPLVQLLHDAETTFANLETPLTTRGTPAEKAFVHRSDPTCAHILGKLGFDVVSLANNHMLDYGAQGLADTIAALDDAGLEHVGAGADDDAARLPVVRDTPSGTVALIGLCAALPPGFAATPDNAGVAPLRVSQRVAMDPALATEQPGMAPFVHTSAHAADLDAARAVVSKAARSADLVVVAIHWGIPHGFAAPSYGPLAEYERPVGQVLLEAGAQLVIGHHPHEVQPIEVYADGLVAYSIGNYIFHRWPELSAMDDAAGGFPSRVPASPFHTAFADDATNDSVVVTVDPPASGRLVVRFVPTTMTDGEPALAPAARAERILARLTTPLSPVAGSRSPEITLRNDVLPDTLIGEVTLG